MNYSSAEPSFVLAKSGPGQDNSATHDAWEKWSMNDDICPCRRKDNTQKGFILREQLSNSNTYVGYSFGDRTYKAWSPYWICHPIPQCVKNTFVFVVHKRDNRMDIQFQSWDLYQAVYFTIYGEYPPGGVPIQTNYTMNGLLLLQSYDKLVAYLKVPKADFVNDELFLLVDGLLGDYQPFSSFGYQDLFEKGYISFERWRSIQLSLTGSDLIIIEEGVLAIEEEEDKRAERRKPFLGALETPQLPGAFNDYGTEQSCQNYPLSINSEIEEVIHSIFYSSPTNQIEPFTTPEPQFYDTVNILDDENHRTSDLFSIEMPETSWIGDPKRSQSEPPFFERDSGDHILSFWNGVVTQLGDETQGHRESRSIYNKFHDQNELRSHLQSGYDSLQAAWFMAIINGKTWKVKEILQASRLSLMTDIGFSKTNTPLLDLDVVADEAWGRYSGMTGLMIAVVMGNLKLVQSLLTAGVTVNVLTFQGTALSLASKLNFCKIIELLLAKNADVEDAIFILSRVAADSDAKRLQAIQTLEAFALALPKEKDAGDMLRQLHSEFSHEHTFISEVIGRSSNSDTTASENDEVFVPSWAHGIEMLKRPAWKLGMSILRKLTRGQVSKKVSEVVILLAIVKSMSTILDAQDNGTAKHGLKFLADLTRWQWIFCHEDGSLEKFREAVHVIWSVELPRGDSIFVPEAPEVLTSMLFQVMAMNMMSKISPILHSQENGDVGNDGLLASQRRWQISRRNPSCVSNGFGTGYTGGPHSSRHPERREDDSKEFSRRFSMLQLSPAPKFDPFFMVLASGAIFGILLLFLIVLRSLHLSGSCGHMFPTVCNQAALQEPVLRAALQHILHILQETTSITLNDLSRMKSNMEVTISEGLITSFSSLIDSILAYSMDLATTQNMQAQLYKISTHWSSTYSLQQNYRALEVYLGFKQFVHIVPMNEFPNIVVSQTTLSADFPLETAETDMNFQTQAVGSDNSSNSPNSTSTFTFSPNTMQSSSSSSTPLSGNLTRRPRNTFCHDCNRDFKKVCNYNKHRKDKHEKATYPCRITGCPKVLSRAHYRKVHEST